MQLPKWPDDPDTAYRYVNDIFITVAPRYDLMKALLSFGQEKRWKRKAMRRAIKQQGGSWLDLATGTGDVVEFALSEGRFDPVFGLDLRPEMLTRAAAGAPQLQSRCVVGDINRLPIRTASVDVVSIAYGMRYVSDLTLFFAEIHRILRPGGTFIAFDLGHPIRPLLPIWYTYLMGVGTVMGLLLHRNATTYWHLVESLQNYPGQHRVADLLRTAGFQDVTVNSLVFGTMAVHSCVKNGAV